MLLEQDLWETLVCQWQCIQTFYITVQSIWENSSLALMKNTINVSNNVNLILNTYRCLFFSNCYWEPCSNLVQCCSAASSNHAMKDVSARQEMKNFWNLQHSKFVNHNIAKMVDVWNVNRLTEARTKMEVAKLNPCHQSK